jgi:hypothetical protein
MHCSTLNSSTPSLPQPPHNPEDSLAKEETAAGIETARANMFTFYTSFSGYMEMYGDKQTVATYLDAHESWFSRCAQPMTVVPLGERGYILTVGRFGSFGYEVEPKLAVVLQPPQDEVYIMHSVPIPDLPFPGYEVDYHAVMSFVEIPIHEVAEDLIQSFRKQPRFVALPDSITRVEWRLKMTVSVKFPKFISRLPQSVVQKTGDRLLSQIVRQVSPRLTYKVQQDFHERLMLPTPPKTSRFLQRILPEDS